MPTLVALIPRALVVFIAASTSALAQGPQPAPREAAAAAQTSTRQAAIEQEEAAKATEVHPPVPNKGEKVFERLDKVLQGGRLTWHPFFENAYSGGGFTLGVGHVNYLGAYNMVDVRGSYTIAGYKRVEVEFVAPRMFNRRGQLSVLGGWREATQVGFYGIGTNTSIDDRTNYLFQRPYGSALFSISPTRRYPDARRRRRAQPVVAEAWRRERSRQSRPYTRRRRYPGWARRSPTCTPREPSRSTGARHPDTRAAAAISARRCTITANLTTLSASAWWSTKGSRTCRSFARRGCSRSAGACSTRARRSVSRSRSSCCRRSAVARRCAGTAAGGSATRTAW